MAIDYSKNSNILQLYNNVCTKGYCKARKHKNDIMDLNAYVEDYLVKNPTTDIRNSSLTMYSEKINNIFLEKKKLYYTNLLNLMMVIGTFSMVFLTAIIQLVTNRWFYK